MDSLVSRATTVEANARGRAVAPVEITAAPRDSGSQQAFAANGGGLYGRSLSRPNSAADLYRSVQRLGRSEPWPVQAHLDVFA